MTPASGEDMDRDDNQGSIWANVLAVVVMTFTVGALYLPLVLR
jgi:hypothetical protein